jgi:hypothetical protein
VSAGSQRTAAPGQSGSESVSESSDPFLSLESERQSDSSEEFDGVSE